MLEKDAALFRVRDCCLRLCDNGELWEELVERNAARPTAAWHRTLPGGNESLAAMTTANKITLVRILLVPFFIAFALWYVREGDEAFRLAAVVTFGVASLSDGLDGYIARRYNQRSELGAILDPLGDKLLLISAIILLSFETNGHFAQIPLWLIIIVLSRDVLLVLGLSVIYYMFGKVKVRPRVAGKIGTVFQMCVVVWILLKWDQWGGRELLGLEISAGLFTGLSGLLYIWDWIQQLNAHPASGPTKE